MPFAVKVNNGFIVFSTDTANSVKVVRALTQGVGSNVKLDGHDIIRAPFLLKIKYFPIVLYL